MIEINVRKETVVKLYKCSQEALDSFGSLRALKVNGDLSIWHCPGLTELPDGLKVNGYLYLNGCTGLMSLPDGLTVGGNLSLYYCAGLKKLPKGLTVFGVIRYTSGTGFYGHEDEPGVIPEGLKHKLKKMV
jgi:hypothetical protein